MSYEKHDEHVMGLLSEQNRLAGPTPGPCESRGAVMSKHVAIIFDHETGTVLNAESCSIVVCTDDEEVSLSDGSMNMETFAPYMIRPVVTDAVRLAVELADGRTGDADNTVRRLS